MRPARSLLLVPGHSQEALEDPLARAADALILDLAATVPGPEKPRARAMAAERIAGGPGARWFLRINPVASDVLADDLDVAMRGGVEAIVMPQLKSADETLRLDDAMTAAEAARGSGKVGLILELDSAKAVFFAHELAAASPRIVSLGVT